MAFRRVYDLEAETSFCVYSSAVGHVLVEDRKYPFGQTIHCGPGKVRISVHAGCIETFPSIYVKGDIIYSDNTWMAEDYTNPPIIAGFNERYAEESQKPSVWEYREEIYLPVSVEVCEDGVLFGFETELTAVLEIHDSRKDRRLRVYCGESRKRWTESIATTVGRRMNGQDDVRDVRCGMRLWRRSFRLSMRRRQHRDFVTRMGNYHVWARAI